MIEKSKLDQVHKNIPVDYYQKGMENNFFQRLWHHRRFKLIIEEIKQLPVRGKILDIGCHSGDLTQIIFSSTQAEVYGLDISSAAISYAQVRFPSINFIRADLAQKMPFTNNYFQIITALDVLEHVIDLEAVLRETKRVLQSGGYFLVGVPSENILFKIVWFFWGLFKGRVWHGTHINGFQAKNINIFKDLGFRKLKEKKIFFGMWKLTIFKLD